MTRKREIEQIEIEYCGRDYHGSRVVEGARKLDQYIIYQGRCIADLHGYLPETRNSTMMLVAKLILSELVSERTISARPCAEFGIWL